jgi:hypothetical protein
MIACNSLSASKWYFDIGLHETDGDLRASSSRRFGAQITVREGASRPLPLAQWQHVAITCDKTTLRLYRNGIEAAQAPCGSLAVDYEVGSLSVGSKAEEHEGRLVPFYCWHGRIDELAVFNRALSAAEIGQLTGATQRSEAETQAERRADTDAK